MTAEGGSAPAAPTRAPQIVVVTGTGTDVGKTVATAALAAAYAGRARVGICKPVQTGLAPGEPGDADAAAALSGAAAACELYRYPEPLAPETAAARAGMAPPQLGEMTTRVLDFAAGNELTLVEGAGGVLVRLGPDLTVLDLAGELLRRGALVQAVVVTRSGLGTLSDTELVVDRIRAAGIPVAGLVLGAHPAAPDLATRCNLADLPRLTGAAVIGQIPCGVGDLGRGEFAAGAAEWVDGGHVATICRGV